MHGGALCGVDVASRYLLGVVLSGGSGVSVGIVRVLVWTRGCYGCWCGRGRSYRPRVALGVGSGVSVDIVRVLVWA